ncbi:MAG: PD40 domain-containing protein [Gemmatimonadaceae bacterium]|nr:PD40 domain-containing protein [Chitinophagaceae bacterium]
MKPFFIIFFLLFSLCSYSQVYDPAKVNKKAAKLYQDAYQKASNEGDFKEGIRILEEAVKIDPGFADAFLSLGGMYGELKNYGPAVLNYQKARQIDSAYFIDYNLSYSINFAGKGEFEKAMERINEFLSIANLNEASLKAATYRKKCYQFAIDFQKSGASGSYAFTPRNLGDNVNTEISEYFPTLTIDSRQLIYTRRARGVNEDFYETRLNDSGWIKSTPLPGAINTNFNEGAQAISQDGQWMIFTGCNFQEGYGSCDLYMSYLTPDGWSSPENLGSNINTESWESAPSLSADKRDLYFMSRRTGGYGGSDLYVSHRMPNGKWSGPENLGAEINTMGDETCPFIHADNQTLYFTSSGHQGYGGDDLFMVRKVANGKWSNPRNLGYPINTIENEGSLVITADGTTAYYASERSDSRGGLDLYTFEMRNDVRPVKTLWIKGKVFDKKTKNGLPSAVELADLASKEIISKIQTDETGNYLITLPVGKDYAFNVNRRGYLFYSENFSLKEKSPDSTYHIDIPLQPLETNAIVVLNNIFFATGKYELKTESQVELDNVAKLMKENPTLVVQINGHTDNMGKAADNLSLSDNRAKAVVDYITSKGVAAARMKYKGFGAGQPVADNATESGRAKNRRTELKVITQ